MRTLSGCLVVLAVVLAGCGESKEETAQNSVCDAKAGIEKQVQELDGLTASTVTLDGVKSSLQTIGDDLTKLKDAQGDLSGDRKDEAEKAWQTFRAEVKTHPREPADEPERGGRQAAARVVVRRPRRELPHRIRSGRLLLRACRADARAHPTRAQRPRHAGVVCLVHFFVTVSADRADVRDLPACYPARSRTRDVSQSESPLAGSTS